MISERKPSTSFYPKGKERKREKLKHKENTENEGEMYRYSWRDSDVYDYSRGFVGVLDGLNIKEFLSARFVYPINILDLGGVGSRFVKSLGTSRMLQVNKSMGVTLTNPAESVEPDNHEVVLADIFDDKTVSRAKMYFGEQKIDFIVSRMAAGLDYIQTEPFMNFSFLNDYYKLLSPNGVMLVQIPNVHRNLLLKWITRYKDALAPNVTIRFQLMMQSFLPEVKSMTNGSRAYGKTCALMIRKNFDAPDELPSLSIKDTLK